jgi:hypothetical protein
MPDKASELVLVASPVGRDGPAIAGALRSAGIESVICPNTADLLTRLEAGAAVAIIAEEAIAKSGLSELASWVERVTEGRDEARVIYAQLLVCTNNAFA